VVVVGSRAVSLLRLRLFLTKASRVADIFRTSALHRLPGFGVLMDDAVRKRFGFVTGLSEQNVADLLLGSYAGSVLSDFPSQSPNASYLLQKNAGTEWAYFKGSHVCPRCHRPDAGRVNSSSIATLRAVILHGVEVSVRAHLVRFRS